ncbi:unnamed protein product, partial [Linum tenue]
IQLELVPLIQNIVSEWLIIYFLVTMPLQFHGIVDFSCQLSLLRMELGLSLLRHGQYYAAEVLICLLPSFTRMKQHIRASFFGRTSLKTFSSFFSGHRITTSLPSNRARLLSSSLPLRATLCEAATPLPLRRDRDSSSSPASETATPLLTSPSPVPTPNPTATLPLLSLLLCSGSASPTLLPACPALPAHLRRHPLRLPLLLSNSFTSSTAPPDTETRRQVLDMASNASEAGTPIVSGGDETIGTTSTPTAGSQSQLPNPASESGNGAAAPNGAMDSGQPTRSDVVNVLDTSGLKSDVWPHFNRILKNGVLRAECIRSSNL